MLQMFINGGKSIVSERAKVNEELKGDPIFRSDSAQEITKRQLEEAEIQIHRPLSQVYRNGQKSATTSGKPSKQKVSKPIRGQHIAQGKVLTRKNLPQAAEDFKQNEMFNLLSHLEEFKARTQAT